MEINNDISTKLVSGMEGDKPPKSEIVVNGVPTGKFVSGAHLEAAIQCGDRCLLLMTDDVSFEEFLSIHLFDSRWNELDSAVLGAPYASGVFSGLQLREPATVQFRFIDESDWSVLILPRPSFRVPFLSEPSGVSRKFGFTRHFIVRKDSTARASEPVVDIDPKQFSDKLKVRAILVNEIELAKAIERVSGEKARRKDIKTILSTMTRQQVLDYVRENGLPEELLDKEDESSSSDGYHLRKEGETYIHYYQEHGSRTEEKNFQEKDWDALLQLVVDTRYDLCFSIKKRDKI